MAVKLTQALRPLIVLMDVNIANIDGSRHPNHRQKHPDVHVIGLSFYNAEERADEMIKAGARLYSANLRPQTNSNRRYDHASKPVPRRFRPHQS